MAKEILIWNTKRPNKDPWRSSEAGFALLKKTAAGRHCEILTDVKPIGPQVVEIIGPPIGAKVKVEPILKESFNKEIGVTQKATPKKKQKQR